MNLRAKIIRELRTSQLPVDTGALALICAPGVPHAASRVGWILRTMARGRIVVRHAPLPRPQKGRPAYRWSLAAGAATGRAA